jgi:hypothetical protein
VSAPVSVKNSPFTPSVAVHGTPTTSESSGVTTSAAGVCSPSMPKPSDFWFIVGWRSSQIPSPSRSMHVLSSEV